MSSPADPFDALAEDYDAVFTRSLIGGLLRRRVWARLDEAFPAGARILDVGCGTGEDAVHLARRGRQVVAVDAAARMVRQARQKVEQHGLEHQVLVHQLPLERIDELPASTQAFDGLVANFGVLNCVADLRSTAKRLTGLLRPGARAVLCVMGPAVPWEWLWFAAHGQPRKGARRLAAEGTQWRGRSIHYPSVRATARAFAPEWRRHRVSALGALLPPSYAEDWALRHPRLVHWLDRVERSLESVPPLPSLADHYLLELELRSHRLASSRPPG